MRLDQIGFIHEENVLDYFEGIKKVKQKIREVKVEALRRRKIVIRMEILQHSFRDHVAIGNLKGVLEKTRKLVDEFGGKVLYDGELVADVLDNLEDNLKGCISASALATKSTAKEVGEPEMAPKTNGTVVQNAKSINKKSAAENKLTTKKCSEPAKNSRAALALQSKNMNLNDDKKDAPKIDSTVNKGKKINRELASLKISSEKGADLSRTRSASQKSNAPPAMMAFLPPHPRYHRTPRIPVKIAIGSSEQAGVASHPQFAATGPPKDSPSKEKPASSGAGPSQTSPSD